MVVIQTLATDWSTVASFDDLVIDIDIIINCAFHIAEQFDGHNTFVRDVCVMDDQTGEVFWNYQDDFVNTPKREDFEEDYYAELPDIDSDCGFDPYLGCFTDDC